VTNFKFGGIERSKNKEGINDNVIVRKVSS
jgi:hypothetical protein